MVNLIRRRVDLPSRKINQRNLLRSQALINGYLMMGYIVYGNGDVKDSNGEKIDHIYLPPEWHPRLTKILK
jgi:hypothetical protein